MMKVKFFLYTILIFCTNAFSGEIALTFDDAPMPESSIMTGKEKTERIIQGLKSQGVSDALFFVTTQYINEESLKLINRYADEGFHLANHSHAHLSANKIPAEDYLLDFYRSHLMSRKLNNYLKLHRFPYLHYGSSEETRDILNDALRELDYSIGYVTVDNFDWYLNGKLIKAHEEGKKINYDQLGKLYVSVLWECIVFYDEIAKKMLGRSPKHVLLLHENEMAAMYIDDLVKHIQSKGWKIISPEEAYRDPMSSLHHSSHTFTKQGRVASIAHSKGEDKALLRHKSENGKYLDTQIQAMNIFE